jgi:hypothetical protein
MPCRTAQQHATLAGYPGIAKLFEPTTKPKFLKRKRV